LYAGAHDPIDLLDRDLRLATRDLPVLREEHAVAGLVSNIAIPERSLKRRFKAATGCALMDYVQNLRIEYDNAAFFRKLFKRGTGLMPGQYRRMFSAYSKAAGPDALQSHRAGEDSEVVRDLPS
jgi:AraC-like DNA-binding protein